MARLSLQERLKTFEKHPAEAGTFYLVPQGTWIDSISSFVYGHDRTADIVEANKFLDSRPVDTKNAPFNLPVIHPGDLLWLPPIDEIETEEIEFTTPDEVAIRIDGTIFRGWTTNSIQRSMNSISDSFIFKAPFDPDSPDSVFLDPHTFLKTDLFIGGKLYIAGRSEKWDPDFSEDGTITTIECRSLTGVIVDCPSTDKRLNNNNQTLSEITTRLIRPFGIKAEFPFGNSGIFNKTKRNLQDKIFSYLQGLAQRAGFVINSTRNGNIKYDKANINGNPIMQLIQGQQPLIGVSGSYDGTQRFSEYMATSQSRGKATNLSIVFDESIPVKRPIIFDAKDTNQGNIKTAALWRRSRALAKSSPVTATVGTWRDFNDNHIIENEIITLLAPNIHIYNETRFLIEKVSLTETEGGGKQAIMTLVLPQAYTTDFPEVFPWQR